MKTLGIVWKVIINIITVAVVLGIFSVAYTEFETVALAVLVLIYLSLGTFTAIWGLHQIEFGEALENEFKAVKDLITLKNSDNTEINKRMLDDINYDLPIKTPDEYKKEIENDEKEIRAERAEKKKTLMIKFYINVGFQVIIYIIALYNLLTALNS